MLGLGLLGTPKVIVAATVLVVQVILMAMATMI